MKKNQLLFLIHDLNPWGGQDKSVLEIVQRMSQWFPVKVYAYSLEGISRASIQWIRVKPWIKRPILLKSIYYYIYTYIHIKLSRKNADNRMIHSTGACSWVSQMIQVQFIHAEWLKICVQPQPYRSVFHRVYQFLTTSMDKWMEKRLYTQDKVYITLSQRCAHDLKINFGLTDPIYVVPHGVDSHVFRPSAPNQLNERSKLRESLQIRSDEFVILFVGAYERKGLQVAIETMSRLTELTKKKAVLLAVGNGNIDYFNQCVKKSKNPIEVRLLSHTRDVLPYYQASDIFLLPTLYEPFGLVILEAMACGLPPVVSECAGASELIKNGESGLIIKDPFSSDEIAGYLEQMINHPEKLKSMGLKAREIAEARSWDQVAEEYRVIFNSFFEGNI